MASACSLTPSTTGRCNRPLSAVSPTGWPYNLAITKSREGVVERWMEQGGADNLNEKEKYEVEKGGRGMEG